MKHDSSHKLKIALIVNPWAGIGGELAMKGSDGILIREKAIEEGAWPKANTRVREFLLELKGYEEQVCFFCMPSAMGESALKEFSFEYQVLTEKPDWKIEKRTQLPLTEDDDTRQAVQLAIKQDVDLLVFAGGDGTARNISEALLHSPEQVCLGIPCGVKIQSGVFGKTPTSCAKLLKAFLEDGNTPLEKAEVRDIDEDALRDGVLNSRVFSELWVLSSNDVSTSMQSGKVGAIQSHADLAVVESLAQEEIAAYLFETLNLEASAEDVLVVGAGHTTQALKRQLGNEGSLLGVDIFQNGELVLEDATEEAIYSFVSSLPETAGCKIIVSVIGGQGFIFGRGNPQLSPRVLGYVLERYGKDAILVLATPSKLAALDHCLFVDTGSRELNQWLAGSTRVLSDYDSFNLCRVIGD